MLSKNQRKLCDLLLFFGILYLSFGPEICHAQDKSDGVQKLLKERRDLLSEAVAEMNISYSFGRVALQDMLQAERESLEADLDWLEKPEYRVKAIERHKEAADRLLEIAKARIERGRGTGAEVLLAKAYVVEVQIALVKEKEKAKSGK